ncbi:MAG: hypothetical protein QOE77_2497 [Blastocatellia bacterium]|jgi:hypothetical protein|nr:hypothetical protein [Blastocatellia bacterium]
MAGEDLEGLFCNHLPFEIILGVSSVLTSHRENNVQVICNSISVVDGSYRSRLASKFLKKVDAMRNLAPSRNEFHQHERQNAQFARIRVKKIPLPPIIVYEITDDQLMTLRAGAPDSIYVTVSLTSAASSLTFFVSTPYDHFRFFHACAIFLLGIAVALAVVWLKQHRALKSGIPAKKN